MMAALAAVVQHCEGAAARERNYSENYQQSDFHSGPYYYKPPKPCRFRVIFAQMNPR
jgi:hypothetical protein